MPFFQVSGVTDQKSLANFAFDLVTGEKQHHFQWLADRLEDLRDSLKVPVPEVIITDKEKALKSALQKTFPTAQQQLCIYYILANARAKINTRWKDYEGQDDDDLAVSDHEDDDPGIEPLEPDLDLAGRSRIQRESEEGIMNPAAADANTYSREGMYAAFQAVVYAGDHDAFKAAWRHLCDAFAAQRPILLYLQKEYLPWRKQWAKYYIDRYRNFGQKVNSPVKTAHADVKSYLISGTSDLFHLHEALIAMINNKARSYSQEAAKQAQRQRLHLQRPWLGKLGQQITYQAVDLLIKQYRYVQAALPNQAEPTCHEFTVGYGEQGNTGQHLVAVIGPRRPPRPPLHVVLWGLNFGHISPIQYHVTSDETLPVAIFQPKWLVYSLHDIPPSMALTMSSG
ncbi:hypothetical protein TOPH_03392 [Tolypocladium ophioglossoides CBS 100239]|uniref:MULE transposase domain-containing protein n=1 Tax=Tolypocladium ophioglossoides (strain CBS 100239) TaxID=1163406 RepID=A0A0L0NDA3_TOLOC|nr:hypothetical protein TOPH_03392 [Tolypocladium ophioglossoides CBS 100239]